MNGKKGTALSNTQKNCSPDHYPAAGLSRVIASMATMTAKAAVTMKLMTGLKDQAARACKHETFSPKSSVFSLGLISKLSFYTSCVMVWREATSDDEIE